MMKEELLREYVRAILAEDDEFGYTFATPGDMYNTFVQPFADVGTVIKGELGKTAYRTKALVQTAIEFVINSVIPFHKAQYDRIWRDAANKIRTIMSHNKGAYERIRKALEEGDGLLLAFAVSPLSIFSTPFLRHSPRLAYGMYGYLGGGRMSYNGRTFYSNKMFNRLSPTMQAAGRSNMGDAIGSFMSAESVIREDAEPEGIDLDKVAELMRDELKSSPEAKRLQSEGQALMRDLLSAVVKNARTVTKAATIQDIPGAELPRGLDKLGDAERKQAEQAILQQVKKAAAKLYTNGLRRQVEQVTKAGVPSGNPMVSSFEGTIKQIMGADQ